MIGDMQPLYKRLQFALSPDHIERYRRHSNETLETVLARYMWNLALCEALYLPLNFLEVALRNAVFNSISQAYPVSREKCIDIACWLDARVPIIRGYDIKLVNDAKSAIRRKKPKTALTSTNLIAELHFGFWCGLFSHEYGYQRPGDERFWPRMLPQVFPYLPSSLHRRAIVAGRIKEIRHLRNHIFHHQPIWHRESLMREYDNIIGVLGWIDPDVSKAVNALCRFKKILASGISLYQNQLRTIGSTYSIGT